MTDAPQSYSAGIAEALADRIERALVVSLMEQAKSSAGTGVLSGPVWAMPLNDDQKALIIATLRGVAQGAGDSDKLAEMTQAMGEIANRAGNFADDDAAEWMPSIYSIACKAIGEDPEPCLKATGFDGEPKTWPTRTTPQPASNAGGELEDLRKANQILHGLLSNRDAEIERLRDPVYTASNHDLLTDSERSRLEHTREYVASITSGQIGGALRQRLVELIQIIDRVSPVPSTHGASPTIDSVPNCGQENDYRRAAPKLPCRYCNGTKRALYFSEQGWAQEWRDCHVCAVPSTDLGSSK